MLTYFYGRTQTMCSGLFYARETRPGVAAPEISVKFRNFSYQIDGFKETCDRRHKKRPSRHIIFTLTLVYTRKDNYL